MTPNLPNTFARGFIKFFTCRHFTCYQYTYKHAVQIFLFFDIIYYTIPFSK